MVYLDEIGKWKNLHCLRHMGELIPFFPKPVPLYIRIIPEVVCPSLGLTKRNVTIFISFARPSIAQIWYFTQSHKYHQTTLTSTCSCFMQLCLHKWEFSSDWLRLLRFPTDRHWKISMMFQWYFTISNFNDNLMSTIRPSDIHNGICYTGKTIYLFICWITA